MKELDIRKLHRTVGVVIAPLLILQAFSGISLSIDWLLGIHVRAGEAIKENIPSVVRLWDMIMGAIHYGLGVGGVFYHILLGSVTIWVAVSGFMLFLKIRERQKKE